MDIYDCIVEGLNERKSDSDTIESYLNSLQKSVKGLRVSYRSYPVNVHYEKQNIQAAYLVAYFPHYYQLIYAILNIETGDFFNGKQVVNLGFIGGGPGSEAYGTIKFIVNNCSWIKQINIFILDINAGTWGFSHEIMAKNIIGNIPGIEKFDVNWRAINYNLIDDNDLIANEKVIKSLNLLVIQNCINEIAVNQKPVLIKNIARLFETLPQNSSLLISDLTSSVRVLLKSLEEEIEKGGRVKSKTSTLNQPNPVSVVSVHHSPNELIKNNLLTWEDGLIPRKNLTYDYIFFSRYEKKVKPEAVGFDALFSPLANHQTDANNFVHTKTFLGLDFGTSTTVVSYAILRGFELEVKSIPIPQKNTDGIFTNDRLVPSFIGIVNKQFMVGRYAAERKSSLELGKNAWYGFKQNLLSLRETVYRESLLKNNSQKKIGTAQDALTIFFRYLKEESDKFIQLNHLPELTEYSVSVPAEFDFNKKQVIRQCLIEAGIPYEDDPFIEEPTAALINYLFESNDTIRIQDQSKIVLTLDIGAGTVDVAIMKLNKQLEGLGSQLLAVSRKGFIGGNLLDEMIAKSQISGFKSFETLDNQENAELIKGAENLKIKICNSINTDSSVGFKLPLNARSESLLHVPCGESLQRLGLTDLSMSFAEFHNLMIDYWTEIKSTLSDALLKSNLKEEDVNMVILNGGGSRNPYIQNFAKKFFLESEIVRPDNIQEHVSKGAALNSFVLNGYGKQIVANILPNPIQVWDGEKQTEIISAGQSVPTFEVELIPSIESSDRNRCLCLLSNGKATYFKVPLNLKIRKLIVSINIDNEPECEILSDKGLQMAKRAEDLSYHLIKITII